MLAAFYASLLVGLIIKSSFFQVEGLLKRTLVITFLIKVLAGFLLWYIYTVHYPDRNTADTWKYFDDALTLRSWWHTDREFFWRFFWGIQLHQPDVAPYFDQLHGWTNPYTYGLANDAPTMVRLNLVLTLFSFGQYEVHVVLMAFFSFVGLLLLYKAWVVFLPHGHLLFYALLFLSPSVLFWSSGVLKEAPLVLAMGAMWWSFLHLLSGKINGRYSLLFLVALGLMFFLKEYVLVCTLPALIFLTVHRFLSKHTAAVFLLVHAAIAALALYPQGLYKAGNILYVLGKKREDFYHVSEAAQAGSTIALPPLTQATDLVVSFPSAFAVTYFRPHVFECHSWLMALSAAENAVYMLGMLAAVVFWKRPKVRSAYFLAALSVVLCSALIIGNAVPVLGAVVRYKIAALPFFSFAVLFLLPPLKLNFPEWLKAICGLAPNDSAAPREQ